MTLGFSHYSLDPLFLDEESAGVRILLFDWSLTRHHHGFGKLHEIELRQLIEIELGEFIPRE